MTSDDAAGIMLRYEDGTRGLVAISQVSAGRKNSVTIEVDGSASALAWISEDPDRLWIGHRGRPNEILQRDPALASRIGRPHHRLPGRPCRGIPRHVPGAVRRGLRRRRRGAPAGEPTLPHLCRWSRRGVL